MLVGDARPWCQANGSLTSVPSCVPLRCNVPAVQFAIRTASVLKYRESAIYSCQNGYFMIGQSKVSCNTDAALVGPACYPSAAPTKYRYCHSSLILLSQRALNYKAAKELCGRYNGTILSEASFRAGCAHYVAPHDSATWVGAPRAGNKALDTWNRQTDLASELYTLCEISGVKCHVPSIDNGVVKKATIWYTESASYSCNAGRELVGDATPMCTAHGTLTSVPFCSKPSAPAPTLTGYHYCRQTGSVLKRISDTSLHSFTDAQHICQKYGGRLLSVAAFNTGCAGTLLKAKERVWIDAFESGTKGQLAYLTGFGKVPFAVHTVNPLGVVCEHSCSIGSGNKIVSISANGNVTCDRGYEYLDTQAACNVKNDAKCMPKRCPIPAAVDEAYVSGDKWTLYGNTLLVICLKRLDENHKEFLCTEHGNFSTPVTCRPKNCRIYPGLKFDADKYICQLGYIPSGNLTRRCEADDGQVYHVPRCYTSRPSNYQYCSSSSSIIIPSYEKLTQLPAQEFCKLYNAPFISDASISAQCALHLVGPGESVTRVALDSTPARRWQFPLLTLCELPCLPLRYDQTQSTSTASNVQCRFDELLASAPCKATKGAVRISPVGYTLNYTSALAVCKFYNGTLLSDASYQAGCAATLTRANVVAWKGLPNGNQQARNTLGGLTALSTPLHVTCEIPTTCRVPVIDNGDANSTDVLVTEAVAYSCRSAGEVLVGDASPTCTATGQLSSVPHCETLTCSVPAISNG
eukprot:scpid41949/ scgid3937/ Sushi, von Willebrand factor type A, EGF and pentraxin domain-containing protein 1